MTTVDDHLSASRPEVVELYLRLVAMVAACGRFEFAPIRSQIGFRVNRIFAGVRLTDRGLRGYLDLMHPVEDPPFTSVSPYTKRLYVCHFAIDRAGQLDSEFAESVAESYAVGSGKHLELPV